MKKIIWLFVLVLGGCFYFITNGNEYANDYYNKINEEFLSHDYLGDDEYIYNNFVLAQEKSNEVRDSIIKDMVSGKVKTNSDVRKLYNNVLDYSNRNSVGIGPLREYIDKIMNSNNIEELVNNVILLERELSVDIFSSVVVDRDFMDNSKNIIYLYPVTFAFGASVDYFVDEDYMVYKAYIKKAIINLLEEYGMSKSEARLVSSEVISFYTEISSGSNLSFNYDDVTNYYNIVDRKYLANIYSNFDVFNYLSDKGISEDTFSLVDELQYKKINELLTDKYLVVWKKVILVKVLSSYASYLGDNYRNIVIDLNDSLTGTSSSNKGKEAVDLVGNVFSDEIDKVYENKVITEKDKGYLCDLFNDVKKAFKKMLEKNTWLSSKTKSKALRKLDAMRVYVGLDGSSYFSNKIEISGDSLVENIISINKSEFLNSLARLDNGNDVRALSEVSVNAYYSPMNNSVYIPSSVMFLLNDQDSYYERLGTIGMIIAHEITHGFDYNGSLFDSNGNLNNWWSDADRDNYARLKNEISEYYSRIEVLDFKYIDGDKTVNENIADMGALKTITKVAMDRGASDNELKIMYSSFASFWQSQVTDEYAKLLLLNDNHSPNKYRVNAVLSLVDEFYRVYNIFPWNDMYVLKKDRLSVW